MGIHVEIHYFGKFFFCGGEGEGEESGTFIAKAICGVWIWHCE